MPDTVCHRHATLSGAYRTGRHALLIRAHPNPSAPGTVGALVSPPWAVTACAHRSGVRVISRVYGEHAGQVSAW